MKLIKGLILILMFCSAVFSQEKKSDMESMPKSQNRIMVVPDSIKWERNFVVLSGSPDVEGAPFVIRIKFSDGAKIPPHWHPIDENLTIISGKLYMGIGETFDETKAEEMTAGSYEFIPKEIRHFGWAKGETIIQIHGIGPFKTFWVQSSEKPVNKN